MIITKLLALGWSKKLKYPLPPPQTHRVHSSPQRFQIAVHCPPIDKLPNHYLPKPSYIFS